MSEQERSHYLPATEYQRIDVVFYWENRDIYDGWSVALLSDGRIVNRWNPIENPWRHERTEDWIELMQQGPGWHKPGFHPRHLEEAA